MSIYPRTSDLDKVVIGIRKVMPWKVIFFTLFEVDVPAISMSFSTIGAERQSSLYFLRDGDSNKAFVRFCQNRIAPENLKIQRHYKLYGTGSSKSRTQPGSALWRRKAVAKEAPCSRCCNYIAGTHNIFIPCSTVYYLKVIFIAGNFRYFRHIIPNTVAFASAGPRPGSLPGSNGVSSVSPLAVTLLLVIEALWSFTYRFRSLVERFNFALYILPLCLVQPVTFVAPLNTGVSPDTPYSNPISVCSESCGPNVIVSVIL